MHERAYEFAVDDFALNCSFDGGEYQIQYLSEKAIKAVLTGIQDCPTLKAKIASAQYVSSSNYILDENGVPSLGGISSYNLNTLATGISSSPITSGSTIISDTHWGYGGIGINGGGGGSSGSAAVTWGGGSGGGGGFSPDYLSYPAPAPEPAMKTKQKPEPVDLTVKPRKLILS